MKMKFLLVCLTMFFNFNNSSLVADSMITSVWNHAYQENWNADSVEDILAGARNAYVLLDPFDDADAREAIPAIKAKGTIIGIYISVGTGEDWRDDFDSFGDSLVEKHWGEWPGEYFIDQVSDEVLKVMKTRIDKAVFWGAGYIEFDNMDWAFDDDAGKKYGFHISAEESLEYVNQLKDYASSLGLLCMAKNMTQGVESFAGVTYESGPGNREWWDPADLKSFLAGGKLCVVFHYRERKPEEALTYYRGVYGEELLVLVETRSQRGYFR